MMEPKEFEELLQQITTPEVGSLKHQDMLANAIITAKDKSALSWWWLGIPAYIIAMLIMKSFYGPRNVLHPGLHEQLRREKYSAILLFLIVPIIIIAFNIRSIRRIYLLSGHAHVARYLRLVWVNLLAVAFALLIILIFLL